MTPIDQTIFSTPEDKVKGNCLQAALASIFELPLEKVPHFAEMGHTWYEQMWEWLKRFGLMPLCVQKSSGRTVFGYSIGTGPGPRGFQHAVVCYNGDMVHDPHPSKAGLVEIKEWIQFVLLDPSKLKDHA